MIKTKKLTKYYGKHVGMIDIDLDVKEREIFGLIGPNGAGKSTMIRTLMGYLKPSFGSGSIMGLDIVKDKKEILAHVGYMPSESIFYKDVKVKDIIQLSLDLRNQDKTNVTEDLIKRFDVDINKHISELSLGNRKKVSLVCAFQHEPKILFLDEPTSGLDPLMKHEFFNLIKERNKKGSTIFFSSHVLSEIQSLCDRAAFIKEGVLIEGPSFNKIESMLTKKVNLKTNKSFPPIPGMKDIQYRNHEIEFLFQGDITQLIHHLSLNHIDDITIGEPNLEEIFMHYYGEAQ